MVFLCVILASHSALLHSDKMDFHQMRQLYLKLWTLLQSCWNHSITYPVFLSPNPHLSILPISFSVRAHWALIEVCVCISMMWYHIMVIGHDLKCVCVLCVRTLFHIQQPYGLVSQHISWMACLSWKCCLHVCVCSAVLTFMIEVFA